MMFVVLAPPLMEKSPLVIVEDALERKPFTNVAEFAERTPKVAEVEYRLVLVAVPKYPIPLAVMLVVLAPPDIVNSPLVIVEEAVERNPLLKVARSDWENAPATESVPKVAEEEKRFVLLAVVAKKEVEVAPPCPIENTVVDALVTASNRLPVPHAVSLLYGVVVPMPTLPELEL